MIKKIKLIITLILLITIKVNAENKINIGINAGLAIPNEKVSQFFDNAKQIIDGKGYDTIANYILNTAANIGYNIQIQARMPLSNNFIFIPTIGITRFNEGIYDLVPLGIDTIIAKAQSTTNIVPISIGFNTYLIKKFISPYINANLCYNYIAYSYDIAWVKDLTIPISTSNAIHRLGYSIGTGIDIDLSLISVNIEAKFSNINIIKYDDNEPNKQYFTFSLGIIF